DVRSTNDPRTPLSIPQLTTQRKPRSTESSGEFFLPTSPVRFSSANRRSGRSETNGIASSGQPPRPTIIVTRLLRYLLYFCRGRPRTRGSRFLDETVRSGERRSPCGGVAIHDGSTTK